METPYLLALTTGALGGFGHCVGMCGPLVASQALSGSAPAGRLWMRLVMPHLLYNGGRIATYGLIGAVMGLTGSFVNAAAGIMGIQNIAVLIAGLAMILMGLSIIGYGSAAVWIDRHNSAILRAAHTIMSSHSPLRPAALGLVMGMLPCGMSYTMFIAAAGTGGPVPGMLVAVCFGIGTMPALMLFGVVVSSLGSRLRGGIQKAGGVLVVIMGVYFLAKGIRVYAGL